MSLRSSRQQPPAIYVKKTIGSSRESNPSPRICPLRAVPLLGHVADKDANWDSPHVKWSKKPRGCRIIIFDVNKKMMGTSKI